jgi:hypothetical protein
MRQPGERTGRHEMVREHTTSPSSYTASAISVLIGYAVVVVVDDDDARAAVYRCRCCGCRHHRVGPGITHPWEPMGNRPGFP